MDDPYSDAALYDLVSPRSAEMEAFYVKWAGGAGKRVLDLACGTGRFTIPLAASGAIVTGDDVSETMLEHARAAAARQGVIADFRVLDMRDFNLGKRFDAIVIAANSLCHLHTHDDFAEAFSRVRDHLEPNGKLLFDCFVPSAALLSLPTGQRQLVGAFDDARLGRVSVEEAIAYDPLRQVSRAEWYWSIPVGGEFRRTVIEMRQIYPQELPLLLGLGGLKIQHRFGDFDMGQATADSWRQVCVAVPV